MFDIKIICTIRWAAFFYIPPSTSIRNLEPLLTEKTKAICGGWLKIVLSLANTDFHLVWKWSTNVIQICPISIMRRNECTTANRKRKLKDSTGYSTSSPVVFFICQIQGEHWVICFQWRDSLKSTFFVFYVADSHRLPPSDRYCCIY